MRFQTTSAAGPPAEGAVTVLVSSSLFTLRTRFCVVPSQLGKVSRIDEV